MSWIFLNVFRSQSISVSFSWQTEFTARNSPEKMFFFSIFRSVRFRFSWKLFEFSLTFLFFFLVHKIKCSSRDLNTVQRVSEMLTETIIQLNWNNIFAVLLHKQHTFDCRCRWTMTATTNWNNKRLGLLSSESRTDSQLHNGHIHIRTQSHQRASEWTNDRFAFVFSFSLNVYSCRCGLLRPIHTDTAYTLSAAACCLHWKSECVGVYVAFDFGRDDCDVFVWKFPADVATHVQRICVVHRSSLRG